MIPRQPIDEPGSIRTQLLGRSRADLARAGAMLSEGKLVAFPTETVYGLGADATSPAAIARLYAAKGRPHFNPLIAHVPSVDTAFQLGQFSLLARKLAEAFWPGPLTLVVPVAVNCPVSELARAGLPSLAIRVPDHPDAQAILHEAGRPIAAPSANRSGHVSPSTAAHVLEDLTGVIDAIVDGGTVRIGVESTILACLEEEVVQLRPGGISRAEISAVIGYPIAELQTDTGVLLAPGRLASHYAPRHALRLDAVRVEPGEACLGFGLPMPTGADPALSLNLSPSADIKEAAANLYAYLRALDSLGATGIAVASVPSDGIGEAIRDRLARAAAPRDT